MCVGFLEKLCQKSGWKRWPVHQTQSWGIKCGEPNLPFHCSSHCTLIKMSLKNEWLNMSVAPVISMSIILKGPIIFPVLASWKTLCLLFTVLSVPVLLTQGTLTRIQGHLERWLMNQQQAHGNQGRPIFHTLLWWVAIVSPVWYKLFNYCQVNISAQERIWSSKNKF